MTIDIPVLIIGAGPAGLASSIMLSTFGIPSLLVERHDGTSIHPKATGISTRTMELFYAWDVDAEVRAMALDVELANSVSATLAEPEHEIRPLGFPDRQASLAVSPVWPAALAQDELEPILLARARRAARAEIRFGASLVHLEQDAGGVDVVLRDGATGKSSMIRARYVIGADGVWSTTRRVAGIGVRGVEQLSEMCSILFRADLEPWIRHRRRALCTLRTQRG